MDRLLHISRSTAQILRRRSPNCKNGIYSLSSHLKIQKDQSLNDSSSQLEERRVVMKIYNNKGFKTSRDLYNASKRHVGISGLSPKGLHNFPCGQRSGRKFGTSATVRSIGPIEITAFNRFEQPPFETQKSGGKELEIRKRLRRWEAEYRTQQKLDFQHEPSPSHIALAKHDHAEVFDEEGTESDFEDILHPIYERGDFVGIDNQQPYLRCGDMVELRASNSFRIELAIFVRVIGSHYQYYTMSGKWIHQKPWLAKFYVRRFVHARELDPLLAFLPSKSVPEALQYKLQSFENALPRDLGSSLIEKMLGFWRESDKIYRNASFNLDNAHKLVAHQTNVHYATLGTLAHKLLPTKHLKNGSFPDTVLYALHRSVMLDELGFQPQKWNHRVMNQFKITPLSEIELIRTIGHEVRQYQEHLTKSARGIETVQSKSTVQFLKFINKVRAQINESRRIRKYTPHGMIGPAGLTKGDDNNISSRNWFDDLDWRYIQFIASWAALGTVRNNSYLHGTASAILRATRMYPDTVLDQRVGWTFLQEVGAVTPWANRTYFDMRLPFEASRVIPTKHMPEAEETQQLNTKADVLRSFRKDWGNLPVYCIDDVGASEIDDGISIEPTDVDNEYWVHVHVADPASMIQPRSVLAKEAYRAARTKYFPDRVIRMLPGDIVQEALSLAPGRRCLTFSARLDSGGNLLETKITPGIVQNIVYLTPATLSEITGTTHSIHETVIAVGNETARLLTKSNRKMTEPHEITNMDEGNLKLLHALADARQFLSSKKGSLMLNSPSFQILVAADGDLVEHGTNFRMIRHSWDPRLELKAEKQDPYTKRTSENTVMNLMLLAGEVGARWCKERGIPIINRISQPHPDNPDPRKYYRQVIAPLIKQSNRASNETQDLSPKDKESSGLSRGITSTFRSQAEDTKAQQTEKPRTRSHSTMREYVRLITAAFINWTPETKNETQDINRKSQEVFRSEGGKTRNIQTRADNAPSHRSSEASRTIPLPIALEYQRLLGSVTTSTTPGTHLHLGLDMFARTTSPLRRYSDLLVHWQIEAALLEEARLGETLIGSTREDYLPFSRHDVNHYIPFLDQSERVLIAQQRDVQRVWAMQALLRAWKFKQAELPATFELWTHAFDQKNITGGLTYFGGLSATFELPKWLSVDDVQIGDVFMVTLANMDIYNRRIMVTPVKRLRRTTEVTI